MKSMFGQLFTVFLEKQTFQCFKRCYEINHVFRFCILRYITKKEDMIYLFFVVNSFMKPSMYYSKVGQR